MTIEPSQKVDSLAQRTIGAAIEVHRHIGPGFLESLYEEALCIELEDRRIPYRRQVPTQVSYKGRSISAGRVDLLIDRELVVELKTVKSLQPIHRAQVMAYLKAMNLHLGLLMNFNNALLKDGLKRVVWSRKKMRE